MADMTDVIQVDLKSDVSGGEKARAILEALDREAEQLKAQLDADTISVAQFNAEMKRINASAANATAGFNAAMGGTTKLGGGLSMASGKMIQFGRLLDDAQYVGEQGLRPVIGQIMELSPALGTALLVGQSVYNNWESLLSVFTGPATKTAAQDMEELAKKTKLTADEAERLGRARRIEGAVQAIRDDRPADEKQADEATKTAIVEAGKDEVARGILRAAPDLVARSGEVPAAQERLDRAREMLDAANKGVAGRGEAEDYEAQKRAEDELSNARLKLAEAQKDAAERLAASATIEKDYNGARKRLIAAIEANPSAFGPKSGELLASLRDIEAGKGTEAGKLVEEDEAARADEANSAEKRRLDAEFKAYQDDEAADKAEQDRLDAKEREYQEKLANWAAQGDQKIRDEDMSAQVQDRMAEWRRDWERTHQSAQVMNLSGLRDAIQTSARQDANPTAVEQLNAQREAVSAVKRSNELLEQIARARNVARAG